jgi:hypothetical protein
VAATFCDRALLNDDRFNRARRCAAHRAIIRYHGTTIQPKVRLVTLSATAGRDVRSWHISTDCAVRSNVCCWGKSGHRRTGANDPIRAYLADKIMPACLRHAGMLQSAFRLVRKRSAQFNRPRASDPVASRGSSPICEAPPRFLQKDGPDERHSKAASRSVSHRKPSAPARCFRRLWCRTRP